MNTTEQTSAPVDSFLAKHLNRQLLKHAAGSAIFCPKCDAILDCRRTVLATIHRTVGDNPEECVRSMILCGKCWDKIGAVFTAAFDTAAAKQPALKPRLEVVDGRKLK